MVFLDDYLNNPETKKRLCQHSIIFELTDRIFEYMNEHNISKSELAKRLGKDKNFVTQVLSSERNFKILTLGEILYALDVKLTFFLEPKTK